MSQQASGAVDRVAPNDHLVGEGHCDRAEAERKGLLVKTQEEQSGILHKQLQEEEHRRKELEQALEEAKLATESKV